MKFYHYTTKAAAQQIVRLRKQGYLEFKLGSQEQSGHATGAYFSKTSPEHMAQKERPISRYLGTQGFEGDWCYVFELDLPAGWSEGTRSDLKPAHITPIAGDRGESLGISMWMTKAGGYADPKGDSDESLTKGGCMAMDITYLTKTYKISSGAGKNKTFFSKNYSSAAPEFVWNE